MYLQLLFLKFFATISVKMEEIYVESIKYLNTANKLYNAKNFIIIKMLNTIIFYLK